MSLSAVSSATTTIGKLLIEEGKYLWGVKDEIKRLEMELSWMQGFLSLKDADVRQDEDKRIRMWVVEIRELAYDAEDVVESFALEIKSKRKRGFVKRSACILNELWLLQKTGWSIEKILRRIADLTRRLQTYGIKELTDVHRASASNRRRELRQSYLYVDEDNIVGLTNEIKDVATLLTKDCQCRVVSICGMGGLGKTTLAKKVYNHIDVRKQFDHFAWVYVSQQFQRKEVWEQVLSSFNKMNKERSKRSDAEVADKSSEFLKGNKCLVILDDVWNVEDWNLLSPAFPTKESHGSKILLTSRNEKVIKAANDGRSCCMYELKVLNEDDSWKLFQKIAFRNISPNSTDYSKLEGLGKEMVKRCEGLPLAITVLGGMLAKYSSQDWQNVSEHVESYLKRDNEKKIEDVLALSYEELPSYLRPCFLYLSHFPEDYEIHANRLIQLWIAEGFVSSELDGEQCVEDVAESYLVELVERFMVQVGKRKAASKIKTCRMHDMMRELCLSKAKQENFFHFMDDSSSNKLSLCAARRIVANRCSHVRIKGCDNVRSILFLDIYLDDWSGEDVSCIRRVFKLHGSWEYIFNHFKLVRVLDFEGRNRQVYIELPNNIGNLIHLRFLSFRSLNFSYTSKFLSFLGNLTCLQTLDLRSGSVTYVPNVLWKLEQLKHLYLPRSIYKKKNKLVLHTLTKLQTFVNFDREFCWATHLSKLTSLRKLKMIGFFSVEEDFNKDSDGNPLIIKREHLMYLSISSFLDEIIEPTVLALFLSNCPKLCKLSLKNGKIVRLPEYCNFSSDIEEIILSCHLEEDPIPTLEKLPNLRILNLTGKSFIGKEMVCSPHGFPKLHSLTLQELVNLEEWKVDEGAMPALRHLSIGYCVELKKLPNGLRFITTLQELKIIYLPKEFKDKVEEGFHHLPSLIFQQIYENKQEEETISINEELDQKEVEIVSTDDD